MSRTHVQQSQISGSLSFNDSVLRADLVKEGRTLADDLDSLRSQVKSILGSSAWTDEQDVSLSQIHAAVVVDGTNADIKGQLHVSGSAALDSSLDVAGAVDLAASGVATSVRGTFSVAEGAAFNGLVDFNADVTANKISIDSDVAQRLYIVDSDGSIKDEEKLTFDGSKLVVTGSFELSSNADLNGQLDVAGAVDLAASGVATAVRGTFSVAEGAAFNGLADFNADVTANKISIDSDVAQRLYIVDADGSIKDEEKLTFDGSKLVVTGSFELSSDADLNGDLDVAGSVDLAASGVATAVRGTFSVAEGSAFNGLADFNADITTNKISIDSDVAQRLYIVDADGSIKDEEKLTFDGSKLVITGSFELSSDADLNGDLDVAGQVDLAAVGVSTNIRGLFNVAGVADFNGGVTANEIKIDGDQAQRLYIVDADGSMKDESKLTFDGSELAVDGDFAVTGDAVIAGNVQVDGDLRVKGSMTYIDTTNVRIQDAFIYLATGSLGTTDSGIVLHGGAGAGMDLVIGQDGGAGEFIFGKGDRSPDGEGSMNGVSLVPAWLSEVKIGSSEGNLSGSISLSGADIVVKSDNGALKLDASGEQFSLASTGEEAAFIAQFGSSTSLVGAILSAAGAGGNSSFRKSTLMGSSVNGSNQLDISSIGSLRAGYDSESDIDVFVNGVLLAGGAGKDYVMGSASRVDFAYGIESDDIVTIIIRNAAL